jgi:methyl-accepting chemotaxis protein
LDADMGATFPTMDDEIAQQLREIKDLVAGISMEPGLDQLDVRNELEEVEERLAEHISEARDTLGHVISRVEELNTAIEKLQRSVNQVDEGVQGIQLEMPG